MDKENKSSSARVAIIAGIFTVIAAIISGVFLLLNTLIINNRTAPITPIAITQIVTALPPNVTPTATSQPPSTPSSSSSNTMTIAESIGFLIVGSAGVYGFFYLLIKLSVFVWTYTYNVLIPLFVFTLISGAIYSAIAFIGFALGNRTAGAYLGAIIGTLIGGTYSMFYGYALWKDLDDFDSISISAVFARMTSKFPMTQNRLLVLVSKYQIVELRATKNGMKISLYDIRYGHNVAPLWTLPIESIQEILESDKIQVEENLSERPFHLGYSESKDSLHGHILTEEYRNWGKFTIGDKKNLYYSKQLFNNPSQLKDKIRYLLKLSIQMANKKKSNE